MSEIKLLAIHNGYDIIGYAKDYEEIETICDKYCEDQTNGKISFKRKRVLNGFDNDGNPEYTLIYQYSTLYLEMFHCTSAVIL